MNEARNPAGNCWDFTGDEAVTNQAKIAAAANSRIDDVLKIIGEKKQQQLGFRAGASEGTPLWGAYNIAVGVCADIEFKIAALNKKPIPDSGTGA